VLFSFKHLGVGDRAVGDLHKVLDRGGDGFFVFGCDEEAREADELELGGGDEARGEEAVGEVGAEEERFGEEAEAAVDLEGS
jgi:hypothetical protein